MNPEATVVAQKTFWYTVHNQSYMSHFNDNELQTNPNLSYKHTYIFCSSTEFYGCFLKLLIDLVWLDQVHLQRRVLLFRV